MVLAVPALSTAEVSALKGFDIEGIEEVPAETRSKLFPGLDPSRKLMEVAWD